MVLLFGAPELADETMAPMVNPCITPDTRGPFEQVRRKRQADGYAKPTPHHPALATEMGLRSVPIGGFHSHAPILRRYHERDLNSGNLAVYMSETAVSSERTKRLARSHRIEAKTSPRIGDHKEALHENQEDVKPRPFIGLAVEPDPERHM